MHLIEKEILSTGDKIQILRIWNNEYPKSLVFPDASGFDTYLTTLLNQKHYLFQQENSIIQAWACKFTRDNEKWFVIILDESIQGKKKGTEILNAIKENENALNAWVNDKENDIKRNGEIYKCPLAFYLKNDFKVCPEIRLKNEKISAVKIVWRK